MYKKTLLCLAALLCYLPLNAKVTLPQIFQDGMVLQRGKTIPVWGKTNAGETVTVSLNKKKATATADSKGRWRVDLPAMKAGGPYILEVKGEKSEAISLTDVWVGDVWLCSGQSNMETTLERVSPQ
jgi:sialate O-acetylesterase